MMISIIYEHGYLPSNISSFSEMKTKVRNYDRVSKNIQATADLMREGKMEGINSQHSHYSQVILSNLVRVHEP